MAENILMAAPVALKHQYMLPEAARQAILVKTPAYAARQKIERQRQAFMQRNSGSPFGQMADHAEGESRKSSTQPVRAK
jgi:hypothetical protein